MKPSRSADFSPNKCFSELDDNSSFRPPPSNHTNVMPSFFLHDPTKTSDKNIPKSLVTDRSNQQKIGMQQFINNYSPNDHINNNNGKYHQREPGCSLWTHGQEKSNSTFYSNSNRKIMSSSVPVMSITDLLGTHPNLFDSHSPQVDNKPSDHCSFIKYHENHNKSSNIGDKHDKLYKNDNQEPSTSALDSTFDKDDVPILKREETFTKQDLVSEAGLDLVPARESESSIVPHLQSLVS